MMNYKELVSKRYSCRKFLSSPLKKEEEEYILDCGLLTPSSFGLEGWHVYSVSKRTRPELLEPMFKACFSQPSVKSSTFITVLTYKRPHYYVAGSDMVRERSVRFDGGEEAFELDFREFYNVIENKNEWSKAQTYLLAMNMVLAGTSIGVESCILEGFDEKAVASLLDIDLKEEGISLVIPFGYPDEKMRGKIRIPKEEFNTYL